MRGGGDGLGGGCTAQWTVRPRDAAWTGSERTVKAGTQSHTEGKGTQGLRLPGRAGATEHGFHCLGPEGTCSRAMLLLSQPVSSAPGCAGGHSLCANRSVAAPKKTVQSRCRAGRGR